VIGGGLFGPLSGLVASLSLGESADKSEQAKTEILTALRALRAEVTGLRRGPVFPARGSDRAENLPPTPLSPHPVVSRTCSFPPFRIFLFPPSLNFSPPLSFSAPPTLMPENRCPWPTKPLDIAYHDTEWGVPHHDDRALFELITLEGAQAGLSWSTILAKRENYRRAFDDFDVAKIARYDAKKVAALLADAGIVRHRLKIAATIGNAKAFLAVQTEFGSFDRYLWGFVPDRRPIVNRRRTSADVPTRTAESDALAKDLAQRGFKFVGTTIIYAFLQATGLVNDHLVTCACHARCAKLK
jgi:DNA-3-methyladenine glycosylase I